MSLKVVGGGFGRTGTLSMKKALEELGFGACHHMEEVMAREDQPAHWQAATDGKPVDWDAAFSGFHSTVDWPSAAFWPEITAHFPDAKVLLTVRSTESWYKSISNTIFKLIENGGEAPEGHMGDVMRMVHQLISEKTFGGKMHDEAHVKSVYEQHNAKIIDSVPADKLLVYKLGDGWEPLCAFLGVPVPDSPFPRINSTNEFWEIFGGGKMPE